MCSVENIHFIFKFQYDSSNLAASQVTCQSAVQGDKKERHKDAIESSLAARKYNQRVP